MLQQFVLLTTFLTVSVLETSLADQCVVTDYDKVLDATKRCTDILIQDVSVPAGQTLKLDLLAGTNVSFVGSLSFGAKRWDGPLVSISGHNLTVQAINDADFRGQGPVYWEAVNDPGPKPQFFQIEANDSTFSSFQLIEAPKSAVLIINSTNVRFDQWIINNLYRRQGMAVDTDAFTISNSKDVAITNSFTFTEGDILNIKSGENILYSTCYAQRTTGVTISVGSSKSDRSLNTVKNVTVSDVQTFYGDGGITIRTEQNAGSGSISDITFMNMMLVDQDEYGVHIEQSNADIPITNLKLIDINGQVVRKAYPVYISCAKGGCSNWSWSGVTITGNKKSVCNYEPEGYKC